MNLKNYTERILQFAGGIGMVLGMLSILEAPTLILPGWFLMLLLVPIGLLVSFAIGLVVKSLSGSKWNVMTFTLLITGVFGTGLFIAEYRPARTIIVAKSFSGDARLFLSNGEDDFELNECGVGYISLKTFENGFRHTVLKDGKDITANIGSFSVGSHIYLHRQRGNLGPYEYLSFRVPWQRGDSISNEASLDICTIDTSRLLKR